MSASERRVLVIVRAGDESLHPQWLVQPPSQKRNWDLHISYFGDLRRPYRHRASDITLSFEKGTKAIGTAECLEKLGSRIDHYDWFWLPDDDLSVDLPTINRFFEIVAQYDLDLAQPALDEGSYISHQITVRRPHMRLRYTSFVEVMAACFSRKALDLCAPYFGATASSWGQDLLFPKLLGYPERGIAVIDESPVVHTRPVGGPNMDLVARMGIDPREELAEFRKRHDLEMRREIRSGIDRDGNYVTDLAAIDRHKVSVK
ncbi:DUF707 domain-containing protein [Aestuariivirga sp. YIM B02566]|uniref:DUF707 domain-containing protein n=1 Tax=Taklimakanibacter albus TaxID=2800327 RepID=A0ACC5RA77_9HYPH|nr:DUF707 domain-containing protein [Aestuariivirga sp. YIM B02566]MBK1869535.1 DUF707 domain-containing protein [Aestuariivirga sp. YIM B02566]